MYSVVVVAAAAAVVNHYTLVHTILTTLWQIPFKFLSQKYPDLQVDFPLSS